MVFCSVPVPDGASAEAVGPREASHLRDASGRIPLHYVFFLGGAADEDQRGWLKWQDCWCWKAPQNSLIALPCWYNIHALIYNLIILTLGLGVSDGRLSNPPPSVNHVQQNLNLARNGTKKRAAEEWMSINMFVVGWIFTGTYRPKLSSHVGQVCFSGSQLIWRLHRTNETIYIDFVCLVWNCIILVISKTMHACLFETCFSIYTESICNHLHNEL